MKMNRLFAVLAVAGLAGSAWSKCPDYDPADYWNRDELFKVPSARVNPYPESDYRGVKAFLVEGVGPNGSKAEFFAYYSAPKTPMPKGGYPGVVLMHGGGGTANPKIVELYNQQGFAAIMFDWYNQRPAPGLTNVAPNEVSMPRKDLAGGYRHCIPCAVANAVVAHSLLRSFPEVNGDKTVFIGLSWGSWQGSAVNAVDDRFCGACMIYLCTRCDDDETPIDVKPDNSRFVMGPFHKAIKNPLWWIVSPRDANGTPESMQCAFETVDPKLYKGATIVHNLGHSHGGFWDRAVWRMARYFVGMDTRVPMLSMGTVGKGRLVAKILDPGKGVDHALLWYTKDPFTKRAELEKRVWASVPATIEGDKVCAEIPEGADTFYLSAYEAEQYDTRRNLMCGSSGFHFKGEEER